MNIIIYGYIIYNESYMLYIYIYIPTKYIRVHTYTYMYVTVGTIDIN